MSLRRRRELPEVGWREKLQRALSRPTSELVIMGMIFASVAVVVADETATHEHGDRGYLTYIDRGLWLFFFAELTLRLVVARKKSRFFRRYWPDLIALTPPLTGLRFLGLLRLMRLFRLGLLLSRRLGAVRGLFRVNVYEVWVLFVLTVVLVIGSSVMLFLSEGATFPTFPDAVWWSLHSIIAGEPVGAVPTTLIGKAVLVGVMLSGMSLFAVFTGVVSATIIDRLSGRKEVWDMDLDELEGHVVICGYNAGVPSLLHELAADRGLRGAAVVLVNELERLPDLAWTGLRDELLYHHHGDPTRLEVLKHARVSSASRAVVMADAVRTTVSAEDRDARTVLAALTIEKLNPEIMCTVELMDPSNESHLRVAGVEAILMRNDLSGRMLATACRHPELVAVIMELVTLYRGETIHYVRGPTQPIRFDALLIEVKQRTGALPIGVVREVEGLLLNPKPEHIVVPNDRLIVIGVPDLDGTL